MIKLPFWNAITWFPREWENDGVLHRELPAAEIGVAAAGRSGGGY